jgi:hypothetical protein
MIDTPPKPALPDHLSTDPKAPILMKPSSPTPSASVLMA